jgi:putative transposase insK for insertion sequence
MLIKGNFGNNAPIQGLLCGNEDGVFYRAGELTMDELMKQIEDYMDSYNQERCSSKLKSRVPSHIEPGLL